MTTQAPRVAPPRFARQLAARLIRDDRWRDVALGDLDEEFGDVAAARSPMGARLWYWTQVASLAIDRLKQSLESFTAPTGDGRMGSLLGDIRIGLRSLAHQPLVTTVIVVTLALGLGANAATFGLVDRLLVRPFPFSSVDRLVVVSERGPTSIGDQETVSPANYLEWRTQVSSVRRFSSTLWWDVNLAGGDRPERVQGYLVSANFFEMLGVVPALGRTLQASDETWGQHRQVVISEALWQRRFGGRPDVVGQTIRVDGETRTIVGVAPHGFQFPYGTDVWGPMAFTPEQAANRSDHYLTVMGELDAAADIERARAELTTIYARQKAAHPDATRSRELFVLPFTTAMVDVGLVPILSLWQSAALFLLLIGCFNVAGLLVARGADRQGELGIRLALGARRGQIVRQLLVESLVLGAVAVPLALASGWLALRVLRDSMPAEILRFVSGWTELGLDLRVAAALVATTALTCLVFGLWPAVSASGVSPTTPLREGGRTMTAGARRSRLRRGLVVAEIALAMPLLVASGLATLAAHRLANGPQGYDPAGVYQMRMILPAATYGDASAQLAFVDRLIERASEVPGVEALGVTSVIPAGVTNQSRRISIDGVADDPNAPIDVNFRAVSPAYLHTLRIPIHAGRSFTDADRDGRERVAIVSESLAGKYLSGGSALGRRIRFGNDGPWMTVVGVSRDTVDDWFVSRRVPTMYVPFAQVPGPSVNLVARTSRDPVDLAAGLRDALSRVDVAQPAFSEMTLQRALHNRTVSLRFVAGFMGGVGALALLLAGVGVYGLMAHYVGQRRHELGVRMALGASTSDVVRLAVGHGMRLAAVGIVLGLTGAAMLSRLIENAMFGVIALEYPLFVAVTALLIVVAFAATIIPAARAARLDPTLLRR
jgi:putative ABC transport system permease protein